MISIFRNLEEFNEELANVYDFFGNCEQTVIQCLKENGSIEIPESEQHEFTFNFLEMEGSYTVKKISLNSKGDKYELETESESGDIYYIESDYFTTDLTIQEMVLNKVLSTNKR